MSRKHYLHKYLITISIWLFFLSIAVTGQAYEFKLIPGAILKQEFNDNIFYSSTNERSSFISTVSPKLSFIDRTDRFNGLIDARLDLLFYTRDSHMNSVDQSYNAEAGYQFTPSFRAGAKAGYDHLHRPDSYLESTGQVSTLGSDRQNYSVMGDLTLTERLIGTLKYDYAQTDYSRNTISGYRSHNVSMGAIYDMGNILPMLKLRSNLGYGRNEFSGLSLDQYMATIGFGYNFHELWSVQTDVGAIYTNSKIDFPRQNKDSLGCLASLTFLYKGELTNASLNFSRSVQGAYGRSGAVERTSVTFDLRRRFTYELSGRIGGGFYLNNTDRNQYALDSIDETTYRINTSLRYDFNQDVNVDCYYEFANLKNNQLNTNVRRNMVFVRLTMQWPLFE
jgi:hypothetical protein